MRLSNKTVTIELSQLTINWARNKLVGTTLRKRKSAFPIAYRGVKDGVIVQLGECANVGWLPLIYGFSLCRHVCAIKTFLRARVVQFTQNRYAWNCKRCVQKRQCMTRRRVFNKPNWHGGGVLKGGTVYIWICTIWNKSTGNNSIRKTGWELEPVYVVGVPICMHLNGFA